MTELYRHIGPEIDVPADRVTKIEDIYDAIMEEGLEILYPLDEKPYGMKDLWCFDPDGYLVVLEEPWE